MLAYCAFILFSDHCILILPYCCTVITVISLLVIITLTLYPWLFWLIKLFLGLLCHYDYTFRHGLLLSKVKVFYCRKVMKPDCCFFQLLSLFKISMANFWTKNWTQLTSSMTVTVHMTLRSVEPQIHMVIIAFVRAVIAIGYFGIIFMEL